MGWSRSKLALALCGLYLTCAPAAQAQMNPANDSSEPDTGYHVGGMMLYPTVSVSGAYNDNVFAVQTGAKSDFSYEVRPAVSLQTTMARYLFALNAEYSHRGYAKYTGENSDDFLFGGKGAFNVASSTMIEGSTEFARLTEARGDTNLPAAAAKPTNYYRWASAADIKHVFVDLQAELGGTYTTMRFDNSPAVGGGTIQEVRRDRDVTGEYLDLGYQFSPGYQVFTRGSLNQRQYRLSVSDFRNSHGYEAVGGVRAQLSHLVEGQAYIGYLSQHYGSFSKDVGGFDYGLKLDWDMTPLTKVKADVSRSIEETDQLGSPSYFMSAVTIGIEHTLTRSITLMVGGGYANNKYQNIARNEDVYSATIGVQYAFTPRLSVAANYKYASRNTTIAGANYDQNIFEIRLNWAR